MKLKKGIVKNMIKEFDGSQKMMEDIIYIDSKSFKDIDVSTDELCERIKRINNMNYSLNTCKIFQLHI